MLVPLNHVEAVPRRIRATIDGTTVLDTVHALYVWEWPNYPQYYIPLEDVRPGVLVDEQYPDDLGQGPARRHTLRVGSTARRGAAHVYSVNAITGLSGSVRFEWDALDSWFEEEEEVFVHPRNPYTRIDALRSTRSVRIELDGVVLAESRASVMVFETGLPTRYYLDRAAVNFEHLVPTDTVSSCPYKGNTSSYWSVAVDASVHEDLAWTYAFPTRQLLPIAGLIAFYNEKVDVIVDGELVPRPVTHFFS
ncbi:MAG: DUF427 domain-containing protein [Jatrophihabitans sp.]